MEGTKRSKQVVDGEAQEVMASPFHPLHLFENHDSDSSGSSPSSTHQEALTAAAYANFVHNNSSVEEEEAAALLQPSVSPVGILLLASASTFSNQFSLNFSSQTEAAGSSLLHRQLQLTYSRASEVFKARTSPTVQDAVQEHGPSGMSIVSDGDEGEAQAHPFELTDEIRGAICNHPLYPELVFSHIGILKMGAPRELLVKLDDIKKKFQRSYEGGRSTSKLDQNPELDHFMQQYALLLASFQEDLEEPFNKFSQFIDKTTKELEDICGHYVETKPEEKDNFGFDIGPADSDDDNSENTETTPAAAGDEESPLVLYPADVDESIVVDPEAGEEELKKALRRKFGRHIGALKAEFNRVRKKGKLPDAARRVLKEWFNLHSHWPYPSEMEKTHLQRLCNLTLKQVNNWFINERKRHWNSEERSTHSNPQLNGEDAPGDGAGLLENL